MPQLHREARIASMNRPDPDNKWNSWKDYETALLAWHAESLREQMRKIAREEFEKLCETAPSAK